MTTTAASIERMRRALRSAWSSNTSTLWTATNPARGQCSVTALAVQSVMGGEILKTPVGDAWHFYNRIEGQLVDFTAEQFEQLPSYLDLVATRFEVLADTTPTQYQALLGALRAQSIDDSRQI